MHDYECTCLGSINNIYYLEGILGGKWCPPKSLIKHLKLWVTRVLVQLWLAVIQDQMPHS